METERMDVKDFITYLHEAGEPQYAKIHPDNIVEYCTLPSLMYIGVMPDTRDKKDGLNIALGFASAISPLCPEGAVIKVGQIILPLREEGKLEIKIRSNGLKHNNSVDMPGAVGVRIFYQAKAAEEFEDIRRFIESIPEDSGKMPKEGQLFFGYD